MTQLINTGWVGRGLGGMAGIFHAGFLLCFEGSMNLFWGARVAALFKLLLAALATTGDSVLRSA